MSRLDSIPNHTIDPKTGFVESNGYASAFDAPRKIAFLDLYKANGLALYRTCREMGLSCSTIHRHYKIDELFKKKMDDVETEYLDELEAISRTNALNPRSVIERIFQLKALRPDKYGDEKRSSSGLQIQINFDGKSLELVKKREQVLDAEVITGTETLATESMVMSDRNGSEKAELPSTVEHVDTQHS